MSLPDTFINSKIRHKLFLIIAEYVKFLFFKHANILHKSLNMALNWILFTLLFYHKFLLCDIGNFGHVNTLIQYWQFCKITVHFWHNEKSNLPNCHLQQW